MRPPRKPAKLPRGLLDLIDAEALEPAELATARKIAGDLYPERFIAALDRARSKSLSRMEMTEVMRGVFVYDWDLERIGKALPPSCGDAVLVIRAALVEIGRLHA